MKFVTSLQGLCEDCVCVAQVQLNQPASAEITVSPSIANLRLVFASACESWQADTDAAAAG